MKCLKTLIFICFLTPVFAFAACSEAGAKKLVQENLTPRIQFIKQQGLWSLYVKATEKQDKLLLKAQEQKDWDSVCAGILQYTEMADDILAGGTGQSETLQKPWKQCAPEKILVLEKKFRAICLSQPNPNCAKDELVPLTRQLNHLLEQQKSPQALKPADYVDKLCETLAAIIKIVKE